MAFNLYMSYDKKQRKLVKQNVSSPVTSEIPDIDIDQETVYFGITQIGRTPYSESDIVWDDGNFISNPYGESDITYLFDESKLFTQDILAVKLTGTLDTTDIDPQQMELEYSKDNVSWISIGTKDYTKKDTALTFELSNIYTTLAFVKDSKIYFRARYSFKDNSLQSQWFTFNYTVKSLYTEADITATYDETKISSDILQIVLTGTLNVTPNQKIYLQYNKGDDVWKDVSNKVYTSTNKTLTFELSNAKNVLEIQIGSTLTFRAQYRYDVGEVSEWFTFENKYTVKDVTTVTNFTNSELISVDQAFGGMKFVFTYKGTLPSGSKLTLNDKNKGSLIMTSTDGKTVILGKTQLQSRNNEFGSNLIAGTPFPFEGRITAKSFGIEKILKAPITKKLDLMYAITSNQWLLAPIYDSNGKPDNTIPQGTPIPLSISAPDINLVPNKICYCYGIKFKYIVCKYGSGREFEPITYVLNASTIILGSHKALGSKTNIYMTQETVPDSDFNVKIARKYLNSYRIVKGNKAYNNPFITAVGFASTN